MRPIDADALKEDLKLPEESGRMGELLGIVINAVIDDAPTIEERKTGRWIPCSESLPEVGQDVLFSVQDLFVSEGCLRDDGDWSQFRWQAIQKKEAVTAWMPLPEPWRGEQDEHTMEEFMYGQDMGNPEDGSL